MVRSSEYGSPFRNIGSGRDVRDKENETKVATILNKYWSKQQDSDFPTTNNTSFEAKYSYYYGPGLGYLFARFYCDAFCSPKYFYFRKLFTGLSIIVGLKYAMTVNGHYQYEKILSNFSRIPKPIQQVYLTGDYRYGREYLNDN